MLQPTGLTVERRVRSIGLIKKLLDARNESLALYNELASKKPFDGDDTVPSILQDFCQALVDYTAHAHFQLYRHFNEKRERRVAVLKVVNEIYPRIMDITQSILDFNDKYDCGEDYCAISSTALSDDLSLLGERLADRIELEDQLIAVFGNTRK